MRDPNRIKRIPAMYEEIWKQNPDQRFRQLYVNLFGTDDLFYLEDNIVEEHLQKILQEEI